MRRLLQIAAFAGTLAVGLLCIGLIGSQTGWFRDWLRRYAIREAGLYLNGDLTVGRLEGNLFYGIQLSDVALSVAGDRVISLDSVGIDYNVADLVSTGIVLDAIAIRHPVMRLERDVEGWNVGRLLKQQRREADRRGPARSVTLPSIEITGGQVFIDDRVRSDAYRLPERVDDLNLKGSFEYEPVHYSATLDRLSFRASRPDLAMHELKGKVAVREDNLYLDQVSMRTNETSSTVDGVIEQYLRARVLKLKATGKVSLPEIGQFVQSLSGYPLHPTIDIGANGPADRLALGLDITSEAGSVRGDVVADLRTPDFGVKGDVDVNRLNLAPILKMPAQQSDITGRAHIDLAIAPEGASHRPFFARLRGAYRFQGPRVHASGYAAENVKVSGRLEDGRVIVDGLGLAYGASATAKGSIVTPASGRPFALDLQGRADRVNLRELPASLKLPALTTNLSLSDYHVTATTHTIAAGAALNESDVEGATVSAGTVGTIDVTPGELSYSANGAMSSANVRRIGQALGIATLDTPTYETLINGQFNVTGRQPRFPVLPRAVVVQTPPLLDVMMLDARGTITDTDLPGFGAHVPRMALGVNIAAGTLKVDADGSFDRLDPAVLLDRKEIAGRAAGTVKGSVVIGRLGTPVTLDTLAADGAISLADSTIGGLQITSGDLQGQYASRAGTITRLTLTGPDLSVESSGRLALNSGPQSGPQGGGSNLTYHIEAKNLSELARILGQDGFSGSAILDGTVTGNGTMLTTVGKLVGNKVGYRDQTALNMNSKYTVTVPDLQFADARLEATTNAALLTIGGVEVQEMNATTTYANRALDFTTDLKEGTRELSGTGKIIFHPDHQEVHLPVLALRSQGIEWRTVPGTDATIQYGNGRLEMQGVRLANGDQELQVAGPLALQGQKTSGSLDVVARNVDLAQLETLLLTNHGLSGRINANAKITGTVDAPTVDGHAEVQNGGFRDYRYQSLVADVDYTGNRVGIDARLQQSATEFITARGSVPRTLFRPAGGEHVAGSAGDQIDLRLQSNALGLGFVQGLTTLVTNVSGTIQADLAVTGSGLDPHVAGTIDIKGGAFAVPRVGVSYTGLDTRIDLTPDAVHLQSFRLLDEHGASLTISGDLGVHERQVGAINITAQSDDFEIMDNELGRVAADSLLVLTGELRRPRVIGDIRLDSGRLELDRILQLFYDPYSVEAIPDEEPVQRVISATGSAQETTRAALNQAQQGLAPVPELPAAPRKVSGASALRDPLSVDVQVHIPDNLIVRGRRLRPGGPTGSSLGDINVTVGGDVRVRKDEGGPFTFIGPIRTVRGTYQFQGRQFEIVRDGTIRFLGQSPPDPLIDVTASRTFPGTGVEARVRITGSVKRPELTLSSTPPLDESDILSLIVFNRTVNDLGTGERTALASTAGGIATGFLVDPLTQSIGKALDLDIFEITTTADEGDVGAGITIGKQVWDRAFLKMRQQFGERNWTEFLIEYQLASFLSMHGSFAPETSGSANRLTQRRIEKVGVDMIFFFSY